MLNSGLSKAVWRYVDENNKYFGFNFDPYNPSILINPDLNILELRFTLDGQPHVYEATLNRKNYT